MKFKNYESLTAKALELHERMKAKINQHSLSFSFCSHCSSHGRYCVVADCSPEERERNRMIAIADSLKDLYNHILSLQKVKWKQKRQREEALAGIEESRRVVRDRVEQWYKEERENSLVEEVCEFVGDDGKSSWWNLEEDYEKSINGRLYRFVVETTRFGLEFLVIFGTIYTCLEFAKKHGGVSNDSRINKRKFLLLSDSAELDVLCGRG